MNQSYLTIRYYALAGTMLAATMLPSATAYAATVTSTGNETWAGTAAQTSANVPTARLDDNLFINGSHTISILNNGVANDGRGTSLMSVGTVTDSGAVNSVLRFEALNGPLTASVVSITDIQSLQAVTTSGHQASISVNGNVSLDNALSMTSSLAGSPLTLSITGNASANTATIQSTSTGTTRLSVGGNLSTTGAITLDSSANQSVLQLNGSIAQTVSGVIQGNSAGQGTVSITNTHANGVTFNNSIGAANSIHSIVIGSGTSNTKAQFKANVRTSNGITLGDGGGTVQTATAVFDMAGGGITINGTINSDGTDTGNVTIQGNNWATVTSSWGQTGKLGTITLSDAAGVNVNLQGSVRANTITGTGGGTHMIQLIGSDGTIDANVTGVDFQIASVNVLTFKGSVSSGEARLYNTGSKIIIDNGAASGTVSGNIKSTTIGGNTSFLEFKSGLLSGNYIGGASDDTLTFTGGAFTGSADFAGGNDTLTFTGADGAISKAVTNLETLNLNSRKLTLSSSISGMTTDVNIGTGGELAFNSGGSVSRAINGNDGTVSFGSDNNGGTFNLNVGIRDAILNVASGTVKTNGIVMGSGGGANAMHNLTIGSKGILVAQDNIVSAGTLRVDGELQINNGKTVSVAGYNSASAGTIVFDVAGGGTLTAGNLDLAGSALSLSSTKIKINVTTDAEALTRGQTITLTQNAGSITLPSAAVIDNSNKYNFVVSNSSGNLVLTVDTAVNVVTSGTTSNTRATAASFDQIFINTDSRVSAAANNLEAATSTEQRNEIIESLQPGVDMGQIRAAQAVTVNTLNLIDRRIASLDDLTPQTGLSAGDSLRGRNFWVQGFGEIADQGMRDSIDGFESITRGFAAGIDSDNIFERAIIGASLSYAATEVQSYNANRTGTDISSYQLTLYGDYDINDTSYMRGMAAFGHHNIKSVRHNVGGAGGADAKSDSDAVQATLRLQTGKNIKRHEMTLSPHLLTNISHYAPGAYTETGAGGLNQTVHPDSLNLAEIGAGMDTRWIYESENGSVFSPSLRIGFRYDMVGDPLQMTSRFAAGGTAFRVAGADPARGTVTLGTGIEYKSPAGWDMTLDYDYERKSEYHSHAATARAGYRF